MEIVCLVMAVTVVTAVSSREGLVPKEMSVCME